jgi:predicted metal-dependent HD superfamily phosphohydrolase
MVRRDLLTLIVAMPIHPLESECLKDFASPTVWAYIQKAYSEPHRSYHTLAHLQAMFGHYADVAPQLAYPRAVRWAIWFHDYVYHTEADRYPLNETLSASALTGVLQQSCPILLTQTENGLPCLALASAMILATKRHHPDMGGFNNHPEACADCGVLLDLDLAILAQPHEQVLAFDAGVRAEFAQYAEAEFAAGRIEALQGFLGRQRIYLSPAFALREPAARNNLVMLISRWQQPG